MKKYRINKEIEINELDNELIIIFPQTEKMYFCNKIVKELICGIREGLNIKQIVSLILLKYKTDKVTVENDLNEIIYQLLCYGILICEE